MIIFVFVFLTALCLKLLYVEFVCLFYFEVNVFNFCFYYVELQRSLFIK